MTTQPNYDKLLDPIADVNTSIESLLEGAFGKLMGDQREALKRIYAGTWGLHTLLLDIITNIGIDHIAKRTYLTKKFDDYITPLTSEATNLIDGIDGPLSEEQHIAVEFIRVTGDLLRKYVDNLWLYSQLKHDLYRLDRKTTSLETLLSPMNWSVTDKPVDLELLVPQDVSPIIVDETLMQCAIAQIVENAMQFTDEGYIRVSVEIENDLVTISVQDTGYGIPQDYQQTIFMPFFQIDDQALGLGLGLPIAQKVLMLHQGTLLIESDNNKTIAQVQFPTQTV